MTKLNTLATLTLMGSLIAAGNLSAAPPATAGAASLEPCLNGEISASGRFPTQAMEDEFNRYLSWVAENGLGVEHALANPVQPVHALEPSLSAQVSASGRFPSQSMEDEFLAYVDWVRSSGRDKIHAFEGVISN
jgi:hypothetical protein